MIIDMRAEAAATDDALGRYELEPPTPESMGGHGDYHGGEPLAWTEAVEVEPRRAWIETKARYVVNLDY